MLRRAIVSGLILTTTAALALLLVGGDGVADAKAKKAKKPATGSIKGVVKFDGAVPERKALDRTSDSYCAKTKKLDEAVLVKDGKLRDVLVRIKNGSGGTHTAPTEPVVVTQSQCMYTPRVVGLLAGQRLEIRNGDATFHNVRGNLGKKIAFNLPHAADAAPILREKVGAAGDVLALHCDVHAWMESWAVVQDHPYFAVTGDDGSFELKGLAAGKYTVEAWHPTLGLETAKVTVKKGKAAKASFTFTSE